MDLPAILAMPDGISKTAALVAWVQGLFESGTKPILVGGAAVELYTGGAYTTGDLDLVGTAGPSAARALSQAGFHRQGRHWIHEEGQVFLEFPSSALHEGERAVRLVVDSHDVLVVSPEDLIAERLAAWQHWRSAIDGVNAWLVYWARRGSIDRRRLRQQAGIRKAEAALLTLSQLARRASRRQPTPEEIERWARLGV